MGAFERLPKFDVSRVLAAAAVACLVLACALGDRASDVAVHEWWNARGPVVPHESFPGDCMLCHTAGGWSELREDFSFDHALETGVPLLGAHESAECLRCHNDRGPVQVYAQRGCGGCHEDLHLGQLGPECVRCHAAEHLDWRPREEIALHARTRFPLVGVHAAVACWACHPGAEVGIFTNINVECLSCHTADLAAAQNPDHMAQGWVDSCDRCHIPTSWTGAGFNHGIYPLVGVHAVTDCADCHPGGSFGGTPTACVDCHLADYNGTTDPDHAALGISTSCEQCHTPAGWEGALFNHQGIVDGCVNCHLSDYQNTSQPNHLLAGFPTSCEACHGTNTWFGATFDHSFPISGPHNRDCIDCHLVPNDFNTFSCTHCHEHRQSKMDDVHDDENGYVWESSACLSCHPNGRE